MFIDILDVFTMTLRLEQAVEPTYRMLDQDQHTVINPGEEAS